MKFRSELLRSRGRIYMRFCLSYFQVNQVEKIVTRSSYFPSVRIPWTRNVFTFFAFTTQIQAPMSEVKVMFN